MKVFYYSVLVVLALLAMLSGITKVLLMAQDVNFFGQFGFNNITLVAFGLVQLVGGMLMLMPKIRVIGALLVVVTFLVSAVFLALSGNTPATLVTLLMLGLLCFIVIFSARVRLLAKRNEDH